jgi:hypothetical protein
MQHALTARAEEDLLVPLDLVVELRWNAHSAAFARPIAYRDHGDPAAPRQDHLVAAAERLVDGAEDLLAPAAVALDVGAEALDRFLERCGFGFARVGKAP